MRFQITENENNYEKQEKLAFFSFCLEAMNLLFQFLEAIVCNTVFVWADTTDSAAATFHDFLVAITTREMKKDISDKYNYGIKRLEIFVSFVCDVLMIIGLSIVFVASIISLFQLQQPEENLILYVLLKFCNIQGDLWFVYKQYKVYKENKSSVTKSQLDYMVYYLGSDTTYLIVGILCYIFRDSTFVAYLNPIFTIITVLYFGGKCYKRLKVSFLELSDHSVSLKQQEELFDVVLANREEIKKINYVNCHILYSILHIDVNVEFKDDVTYQRQRELLKVIDEQIKEKYPDSICNFVIGEE